MNGLDPGPLLSALAGVAVLVGGVVGMIMAATRAKPAELMTENGKLRQEVRDVDKSLSDLRDSFEAYKAERREASEQHDRERREDRRKIGILADGVMTMWSCIQVLQTALTHAGQQAPEWSESVTATMEAAVAVAKER